MKREVKLERSNDFTFNDGSKLFFTSDTHFCHDRIIKFCNRPFKDANEMDEVLIANWNKVVSPDDIVFHLGDVCFGGSEKWNSIMDRLNGRKYLIFGNHDAQNFRQGYSEKFEWVGYQMHIYIEGRPVYLNHYPFLCYGGSYREDTDGKLKTVWQLFGHVHSQKSHRDLTNISDEEVKEILGKDEYRLKYLMPTQYDVGVDNNNFTPVSWNQVKEIINAQIEAAKVQEEN
jgi:calcineurin-like phosphoesterase family protein